VANVLYDYLFLLGKVIVLIANILFLILLIALNAFFSASEMALISLNDNKIKMMADDGDKKARKLIKLLAEPGRFLSTIQIGITLVGFLASAIAAETFAGPFVEFVKEAGVRSAKKRALSMRAKKS